MSTVRFAISKRGGQRVHRQGCPMLDATRENHEIELMTRAQAMLWVADKQERHLCSTCRPSLLTAVSS